jgi:PPOX class probable F420-dependent enzyme
MALQSQDLQDLLAKRNNAIIAINRPEKGPHVTPVWYLWDGEAFYFSITRNRAKYPNIKRDPSISLVIDEGPKYIAAYGVAQIIEQNVEELLSRIVAKYVAPEEVEKWMQGRVGPLAERVIIRLQPEKFVTQG